MRLQPNRRRGVVRNLRRAEPGRAATLTELNGILAQLDGGLIGGTVSHLPPAETSAEPKIWIDVHAGALGLVRIRYRRHRSKRGKSSYCFWVAEHAAKVATPSSRLRLTAR